MELASNNAVSEMDVDAFFQQLPKLIEEYDGKYALIRSGEVVDILASSRAAMDAGRERYGDREPWITQPISARELELFRMARACGA